jgi:hypothetical protein
VFGELHHGRLDPRSRNVSRSLSKVPEPHDTAVQMIDTSIVRVAQHGVPIARNSEAADALAFTDNRKLLLPHLITHIAISPILDLNPLRAGADGTQARVWLLVRSGP